MLPLMGLRDLTSSLTGRRRPGRRAPRPDAPRTIVPEPGDRDALAEAARRLGAPKGATAPAGPLDLARLDAARDRLRREIAPVRDDEPDDEP